MFKFNKYIFLIFLLFLLGFFSCNKTFEDIRDANIDFSTELGLKIVDASLVLKDTFIINLTDTANAPLKIYPGADGIYKLKMSQEILNTNIDTILSLTGFRDSTIRFSKEIPYGSSFYSKGDIEFGFGLESLIKGRSIDSLKLDNGRIKIQFNTYDHFNSNFSFVFPNITDDNNDPLEINNFIPTAGNHTVFLNLSNKKIKIETKNGHDYMVVKLNYYIESNGNEITEKPTIDIELKEVDIEYAYGYFGNDTIKNINHLIDLFDTVFFKGQDITIDFKKPQIELTVLNSFGIPFGFEIDTFGVFYRDGMYEEITGAQSYIDIQSPDIENQNTYVSTKFVIDPNTNLDLLMSKFPEKLMFGGDLFLNPNESGMKNYIRDEDNLIAQLNIDIPFTLNISKINLTDTVFNVNLDSLKNDFVTPEFVRLKTDITNSFPFELFVQIYFTNEYFEIIDTLFNEPMLLEGLPDLNKPAQTTSFTIDRYDHEIENLYHCKNVIINAFFSTSDSEKGIDVSIHKDHKLDLSMTLFSKLHIQTGNE